MLLSICSLLTDPNPDDPLVPEIAHMYAIRCAIVCSFELAFPLAVLRCRPAACCWCHLDGVLLSAATSKTENVTKTLHGMLSPAAHNCFVFEGGLKSLRLCWRAVC